LFNPFEGLKPEDASGVADANAGGAAEAGSVAAGVADTVGGAGTAERAAGGTADERAGLVEGGDAGGLVSAQPAHMAMPHAAITTPQNRSFMVWLLSQIRNRSVHNTCPRSLPDLFAEPPAGVPLANRPSLYGATTIARSPAILTWTAGSSTAEWIASYADCQTDTLPTKRAGSRPG